VHRPAAGLLDSAAWVRDGPAVSPAAAAPGTRTLPRAQASRARVAHAARRGRRFLLRIAARRNSFELKGTRRVRDFNRAALRQDAARSNVSRSLRAGRSRL